MHEKNGGSFSLNSSPRYRTTFTHSPSGTYRLVHVHESWVSFNAQNGIIGALSLFAVARSAVIQTHLSLCLGVVRVVRVFLTSAGRLWNASVKISLGAYLKTLHGIFSWSKLNHSDSRILTFTLRSGNTQYAPISANRAAEEEAS